MKKRLATLCCGQPFLLKSYDWVDMYLHFLNNSVNHDFLIILCLDNSRKKAEPR